MIGYQEEAIPVQCNNPLVKASVYKGVDESIIAMANQTEQDKAVSINGYWKKLGIDAAKCELIIPEIKDFQKKQTLVTLDNIIIPGKQGYQILIKNIK